MINIDVSITLMDPLFSHHNQDRHHIRSDQIHLRSLLIILTNSHPVLSDPAGPSLSVCVQGSRAGLLYRVGLSTACRVCGGWCGRT